MNDEMIVKTGSLKGCIGHYIGRVYDEGQWKTTLEFDGMYAVDFLSEDVEFLDKEKRERDESYNGQRYENYKMLKSENKD